MHVKQKTCYKEYKMSVYEWGSKFKAIQCYTVLLTTHWTVGFFKVLQSCFFKCKSLLCNLTVCRCLFAGGLIVLLSTRLGRLYIPENKNIRALLYYFECLLPCISPNDFTVTADLRQTVSQGSIQGFQFLHSLFLNSCDFSFSVWIFLGLCQSKIFFSCGC